MPMMQYSSAANEDDGMEGCCMIITWVSLSDGLGGEENPLCGSLGEGAACVCGRHPRTRRQG